MSINHFIGIDMAKNDFYACFNETEKPCCFNNDEKGVKSFLSRLLKQEYHIDNTVIGVESTASYHLLLCIRASEIGYRTRVINPLVVKKQNQTDLRRVKTDMHDSKLIRFCLTNGSGSDFHYDPEIIIQRNIIRQRNSLMALKINLDRKQDDIRLKEKAFRQSINPAYAEIIEI